MSHFQASPVAMAKSSELSGHIYVQQAKVIPVQLFYGISQIILGINIWQENTLLEVTSLHLHRGFHSIPNDNLSFPSAVLSLIRAAEQPQASLCYVASPHHFVIPWWRALFASCVSEHLSHKALRLFDFKAAQALGFAHCHSETHWKGVCGKQKISSRRVPNANAGSCW